MTFAATSSHHFGQDCPKCHIRYVYNEVQYVRADVHYKRAVERLRQICLISKNNNILIFRIMKTFILILTPLADAFFDLVNVFFASISDWSSLLSAGDSVKSGIVNGKKEKN